MTNWRLALVAATLGAAACGPAQQPDPECAPGAECVGYEIGMTTGRVEEQINADVPLETYVSTEDAASGAASGTRPGTVPYTGAPAGAVHAGDSVAGSQPLPPGEERR